MDKKRRALLQAGMIVGGTGAFAVGYADPVKKAVKGLINGTSGVPTNHRIAGNALQPEFMLTADNELVMGENQVVSPVQCFGCWTLCGLRARVDTKQNKVLRIAGNPYHPLSNTHAPAQETPVREVFKQLAGESGLEHRSTACARGAALSEQLQSPYRLTKIMKRTGQRGEGKWQTISFEQLISEVVEGGDLFGEGHVEGLRAIRDLDTPVDANNPEFGPKANQLMVTNAGDEGRDSFLKRFIFNSYGTRNFGHHGGYCGFGYRAGAGAVFNDLQKFSHGKPDWDHAEFVLCIGTSPAQAGNPFKRQGRQLAEARSEGRLDYVVVAPTLPNSISRLNEQRGRWVPIKPATDDALAMGIIRWLMENDGINLDYLAQPGPAAQAAAKQPSHANATYLVLQAPHPEAGRFLTAADLGKKLGIGDNETNMVVDAANGELMAHTEARPAELWVNRTVTINGVPVQVKSSLLCLKESATRKTLAQYSAHCGVPEHIIAGLGETLKRHGTKASVDAHGGMMSGNAFYTAFAVLTLNTLLGNINAKGGLAPGAGGVAGVDGGPRYDLENFAGKIGPKGVFLSRNRFPYENSSEYKRKVAAGISPYPARAPWFSFSSPLLTEHLAAAFAGYPYRLKAWISHMTNPLYGIGGAQTFLGDKLKDPKQLPLFIAIDGFINETTALADYIVPDTLTYESWGFTKPWSGVPQKTTTARWPVVTPATPKLPNGDHVGLESFIIAVAKKMDLPGYGDNAITDHKSNQHGLHTASDFYLRAAANLAFANNDPVPDASADDLMLTNAARLMPLISETLAKDEQRKVGFVLSRGGRFAPFESGWEGELMKNRTTNTLCIWNPTIGRTIHSMTGEKLPGCATEFGPRFADGSAMRDHYSEQDWPLLVTSYKSHIMSSSSIGAERLRMIHPENPISINRKDAERAGIIHGQGVRLITPGGQVEGIALVRDGIVEGAIAIEHGYGHTELGARAHEIDGQPMAANPRLGAGVNQNLLGLMDPTRKDVANVWLDWTSGAAVRQGLPGRIEAI
ncbi:tetrathionate reductase subunit A [Oceanisphaera profunda]|uniref:Tetrathionate reductase subunit A n=1 Tax=Oceanisphaera profunda TaxID=1416627 RepID=A0A1Y0D808_9GAMM|nr:molybdopterin dinucleotide binding domain-containing protein [Oceanisphaera profunda]ART83693.1 tetrathionate reductase subunit A [Oceanisphaera profunda]